ncbi:MAG: BRO family protein [bacterium]|nr:BRO family protein [bacterium]
MNPQKLQLYENQPIRTAWDEESEEWYFSIVDVIGVLTDQPTVDGARNYWKVLKSRLKKEGSQLVTNCNRLKLLSQDGKRRLTDVATIEQLLRLIQSIPSPKAEPFKVWLAQIGRERIEETIDPELSIDRALETYVRLGYPEDWINQRLQTIRARKELTDQWKAHGVEQGREFAILTDEVTRAWSGLSTRQYKNYKGLTKENLRDNMSTLELALNMLAEATTTELTKVQNPHGLNENQQVAREGGAVVGHARMEIEERTGRSVITAQNAKQLHNTVTGMIEDIARSGPAERR